MQIPKWYRIGVGNQSAMPNSHRRMQQYLMTQAAPLQAQVAAYTGKLNADLEALQIGMSDLAEGKALICEACGQSIWAPDGGHREDCKIIDWYTEIMALTPEQIKARLN